MVKRTKTILAAAVTAAAAGCIAMPVSAEQAKVDIFQNKSEFAEQLQAAAELYMESHPDVTINVESVQGGDYSTSLNAKLLQEDGPEIFGAELTDMAGSFKDLLEDLSDQPWVDAMSDEIKSNCSVDGKVLAIPVSVEGYGLVYNKEIFEAAGIDASTLTSYDAIDEAFASLQEKIDNGELADQFPVLEAVEEYAAKETWLPGYHTVNVALQAELGDAPTALVTPEIELTYADGLKDLFDLLTKYTAYRDNLSMINAVDYATQIGGGLAIERVAVVQQGNWIAPEMQNIAPDVAEKLDILPIPLKGTTEDSIAVGVSVTWGVNANSSDVDKAAAKDFLNWLFQSDEGKQIVVNEMGCIPAFNNYDGIEITEPLSAAVKRYMDEGKTMGWTMSGWPSGFEPVSAAEFQAYLGGDMTWDECVEAVKNDWASLR
ncbi:MAG: ABC transporter substrate-binding protein [Lachnospiraceae bacterium]|nr:ABC transporter substrate-binding protein [Lachnospiraceae bacterium]